MIHQRIGTWTVLQRGPRRKKNARWLCRCDCGTERLVFGNSLRTGQSKSCGCVEQPSHTKTHGLSYIKEYKIWTGIKQRCYNPRASQYRDYGGRGIVIASEWRDDFAAFYAYVGPRPSPAHTIDRINNTGHYVPGNIRWATRREQSANRQMTLTVSWGGQTLPLTHVCKAHGISYKAVLNRRYRGETTEEAVTHIKHRQRGSHSDRTASTPNPITGQPPNENERSIPLKIHRGCRSPGPSS